MRRTGMAMVAVGALLLVACKPYDFDVDGHADFAFRTRSGDWFRAGATEPFWSDGLDGDDVAPVPGDYDGDDVWEVAAVDELGQWATAGDRGTLSYPPPTVPDGVYPRAMPVAGDYDGDGDTEPAWYDAWTGTWQISSSHDPISFGVGGEALGLWADMAVPADYDGDGDTDVAVFRPSTGELQILGEPAIGPFPVGHPMPADYNGDGAVDFAVYTWTTQVMTFSDGTTLAGSFSRPDEVFPVQADYVGDRSAEPLWWDWNTGRWITADGAVLADDTRAVQLEEVRALPAAAPFLMDEHIRLTHLTHEACSYEGGPCDN